MMSQIIINDNGKGSNNPRTSNVDIHTTISALFYHYRQDGRDMKTKDSTMILEVKACRYVLGDG